MHESEPRNDGGLNVVSMFEPAPLAALHNVVRFFEVLLTHLRCCYIRRLEWLCIR